MHKIPDPAANQQGDDEDVLRAWRLDVPKRDDIQGAFTWLLLLHYPDARPIFDADDALVGVVASRRTYRRIMATARGGPR